MPTIGPYTLHAIETGRFGLDGGAMFGIVPKPLWERRIPPDNRNRIPLHMRCLLLKGEERCILIDTGLGDKHDAKFADLFAVDHDTATLHDSLRAAGVGPGDVTDVILTHLHFDHAGGATQRGGDRFVPTFPNARYHIQRDHWDWAAAPNGKERNSFRPMDFEPLQATGQIHLVEGDGELLPGIDVLTAHGHTHAQQLVKISGPEGTLVYVADLLPTSAHLRPPWIMAYDVRPLVTLDEKQRFLEAAHAEGWHLFFEHDPEVAVASVQQTERGIEIADPRPLDELF
jgi:glyoxylase-like metal-dependent hydrolase (beta-lactamase superfamily II)